MEKSSRLWTDIASSLFSKIDDSFLETFRSPGGANRRLAAWDPFDKSMRYYKFLLFSVASQKPHEFFAAYQKLRCTGIGKPVIVTVSDCQIDIDYLFAVEEFLFLKKHMNFTVIKNVVEIGAGFGRTCHAILSLSDSVDNYTIVDLPAVLKLSQAYLKRAIPDLFERVTFISADDAKAWQTLQPDLAINIDSFQEMPPKVIDGYMEKIISPSSFFYCKNPTGKYRPDCVGLPALTANELLDVYSLGYCQTLFDLFDQRQLRSARESYLKAYQPPGSWTLAADAPMSMFPYVHHALYARK